MLERHYTAITSGTNTTNNEVWTWVYEGIQLGLVEELPASLRLLEKCTRLHPQHIDGWHNRAVTLFLANRFDEAYAATERALALSPDLPQALFIKGFLLIAAHRIEDAEQHWRHLAQRHPKSLYGSVVAQALNITHSAELAARLLLSNLGSGTLYHINSR